MHCERKLEHDRPIAGLAMRPKEPVEGNRGRESAYGDWIGATPCTGGGVGSDMFSHAASAGGDLRSVIDDQVRHAVLTAEVIVGAVSTARELQLPRPVVARAGQYHADGARTCPTPSTV